MDFKNGKFTSEKIAKEDVIKINSELNSSPLAQVRKDWTLSKLQNDTYCIAKDKGEEFDVDIPALVGDVSVTVIGDLRVKGPSPGLKGSVFPKKIKSVVIHAGVKEITDHTFSECSSLTSVTFPKSLMAIGFCAFFMRFIVEYCDFGWRYLY